MGRPGCGKGTQIKFLEKKTGFKVIKTGELLRQREKENDFISKKITETLSKGGLIPTPLVFLLWMPRLTRYREEGASGVIFEGNPRKLYEAKMLEELFEMFGWGDVFLLYIDISEREARERLLKRGRSDDNEEDIKERLSWFNDEVRPVIEYFNKKSSVFRVDGEKSVNEVKKEIEEKLKEKIFI